jgi:hypothetical protein
VVWCGAMRQLSADWLESTTEIPLLAVKSNPYRTITPSFPYRLPLRCFVNTNFLMLPLRASQISQVGAYCVPHSTVHGLAIEANGDQMYCGEKKNA